MEKHHIIPYNVWASIRNGRKLHTKIPGFTVEVQKVFRDTTIRMAKHGGSHPAYDKVIVELLQKHIAAKALKKTAATYSTKAAEEFLQQIVKGIDPTTGREVRVLKKFFSDKYTYMQLKKSLLGTARAVRETILERVGKEAAEGTFREIGQLKFLAKQGDEVAGAAFKVAAKKGAVKVVKGALKAVPVIGWLIDGASIGYSQYRLAQAKDKLRELKKGLNAGGLSPAEIAAAIQEAAQEVYQRELDAMQDVLDIIPFFGTITRFVVGWANKVNETIRKKLCEIVSFSDEAVGDALETATESIQVVRHAHSTGFWARFWHWFAGALQENGDHQGGEANEFLSSLNLPLPSNLYFQTTVVGFIDNPRARIRQFKRIFLDEQKDKKTGKAAKKFAIYKGKDDKNSPGITVYFLAASWDLGQDKSFQKSINKIRDLMDACRQTETQWLNAKGKQAQALGKKLMDIKRTLRKERKVPVVKRLKDSAYQGAYEHGLSFAKAEWPKVHRTTQPEWNQVPFLFSPKTNKTSPAKGIVDIYNGHVNYWNCFINSSVKELKSEYWWRPVRTNVELHEPMKME